MTVTPEDKIRKADDAFYEIFHHFNVFHYLNPTNHEEERARFLASWEHRRRYEPVFHYNLLPGAIPKWKRRLEELTFGLTPIESCFDAVRIELYRWLDLAEARGTPEITKCSTLLFGTPSEALLVESKNLLKKRGRDRDEEQPEVGVKGLAERLKDRLRFDRIEGWDTVEDPLSITLAHVDWASHRIRLQPGSLLSEPTVTRLIHHEIDVHLYRAANGERQPYKVFAIGLDGYLQTEEGLAVELEDRLGLLRPSVHRRYAARVLASHLAPTTSFFDIFTQLVEFFPPDEAFTLTQRSKRGMEKAAAPGGFVQDHIYLQGKEEVSKLTTEQIKHLYVGRISTRHLPLMKELIRQKVILEPAFVPSIFHG